MNISFIFYFILCFKVSPVGIQSKSGGSTIKEKVTHFQTSSQKTLFEDIQDLQENFVNITCMKFVYYPSSQWTKYPEKSTISSVCSTSNCSASATFYGTEVYLEGYRAPDLGEMDIRIDGRFITQITAFYSTSESHKILFSLKGLDYGQHTINITNRNSQATPLMRICNILVQPLPKHGGVKKNFRDIIKEPGAVSGYGWYNTNGDGFIGIYTTNSQFPDIIIKFYGTKFWLTGTMAKRYREIRLIVDEGLIEEDIPTLVPNIPSSPYDLKYTSHHTLLYESTDLPLKLHTVLITDMSKAGGRYAELANFFYITQPKDATIVPYNKFQTKDVTVNDDSLSTSVIDASICFNMYGTNFWFFGRKLSDNDIQMNHPVAAVQETDSRLNLYMLTLANKMDINYYSIELINKGEITVNFAYYLNDQQFTLMPATLEIGYEKISHPSWDLLQYERAEIETEGIWTNIKNAYLTIPFEGEQFWIEGSFDPSFGLVEISLNNSFLSTVSLYREQHHKEQIYYQSKPIEYGPYELTLKNIDGKNISFNKLYVFTPSFLFTLSSEFTNSQSFSKSSWFSDSTQFTPSISFSSSVDFTNSQEFSNSEEFSISSVFTTSISFSDSNDFTNSKGFSNTETFSSSSLFTSSVSFSDSNDFTVSSEFSFSSDFSDSISFTLAETEIAGGSESGQKSLSIGIIIAIVIAILAVILICVLVILIIFRRKKTDDSDIDTFECSAIYPTDISTYDQTKEDPIDAPDSFIPYDPFNQAIEETGAAFH